MKKYIKVILNICIVCFMLLNICAPSIYAADTTMGGIVKDANDFLQEGLSRDNPLNPGALESGSKLLYNILFTIGIAVALIWGLVLAIQFITGSIGEKADVNRICNWMHYNIWRVWNLEYVAKFLRTNFKIN